MGLPRVPLGGLSEASVVLLEASEASLDPLGGLPSLSKAFLKHFQGYLKGHLDPPEGFQGLPMALLGLS